MYEIGEVVCIGNTEWFITSDCLQVFYQKREKAIYKGAMLKAGFNIRYDQEGHATIYQREDEAYILFHNHHLNNRWTWGAVFQAEAL